MIGRCTACGASPRLLRALSGQRQLCLDCFELLPPCPRCDGTRRLAPGEPCPDCHGAGRVLNGS